MTHFFASTGTCGTITGTGTFLKAVSKGKVKVYGVHPPRVHDIPGVRSLPQLKMTDHYKPTGYDELIEVTNQDAFNMCKRLNQEESLIAGPSSGLQVLGAIRTMKDEPGNVGVVIFCDDIFKYSTSVTKYCPELFAEAEGPEVASPQLKALAPVLEAAKKGPDTLAFEELHALKSQFGEGYGELPKIIDVRPRGVFDSRVRPAGAVNVPLAVLNGEETQEPNFVRLYDAAGAVQRRKTKNLWRRSQ